MKRRTPAKTFGENRENLKEKITFKKALFRNKEKKGLQN